MEILTIQQPDGYHQLHTRLHTSDFPTALMLNDLHGDYHHIFFHIISDKIVLIQLRTDQCKVQFRYGCGISQSYYIRLSLYFRNFEFLISFNWSRAIWRRVGKVQPRYHPINLYSTILSFHFTNVGPLIHSINQWWCNGTYP